MTLNCKGHLVDISRPQVMGILNITPDSFYDGGQLKTTDKALIQAERMLNEGATFLDIGGYSTKPNASEVSLTEELRRVVPVIEAISQNFPKALLSVDTFRSQVAQAAIESGACIINDVSGGQLDHQMFSTAAQLKATFVMMHMKGSPQTMMQNCSYEDVTKDLILYFSERIALAHAAGILDIIIDPGFGFSKTVEQNFELLNKLQLLAHLDKPILVGLSRKSMIYNTLGVDPNEALTGTICLNTVALQKGANILRVHDVKEAVQSVELLAQMG